MKRIQRRRTKGWRMPENAVYVGRPTRWGNFFDWRAERYPGETIAEAKERAKELFHDWTERFKQREPDSLAEWLAPLRGKDLACWCKEGEPCHADVLIELCEERK